MATVMIPTELFALLSALAAVAFAAMLSALGWLILRVAAISEAVAAMRQKLDDLPCDRCTD